MKRKRTEQSVQIKRSGKSQGEQELPLGEEVEQKYGVESVNSKQKGGFQEESQEGKSMSS